MKNDIIVAGHICVDFIIELDTDASSIDTLFVPGKLLEVGPPVFSGGGAVFNTGIALHRLGSNVRLIGKAGDDVYGKTLMHLLQQENEHLADNLVITQGSASSYTIVLSSPKIDRIFLHHTGANDTFSSVDVTDEALAGGRLFHFGYPPLMKQMYEHNGEDLVRLFRSAHEHNLVVSLDMAMPGPGSVSAKIDWRSWLISVLPHVDIFLPSIDELNHMLDRPLLDNIAGDDNLISEVDGKLLGELSDELLSMGAAIVVIKLGADGLYMRTTDDSQRLLQMDPAGDSFKNWKNLEFLKPCFKTRVVGTTGSGDCAIAGFLSAISDDATPLDALTNAAALGAISVEQPSSVSAIPVQEIVTKRIQGNWQQHKTNLHLPGWSWDARNKVWAGPC